MIEKSYSARRTIGRVACNAADYWRVLRTLGGRNIGKCRLRAHQHPPLPPLSNLPALRLLQAGESSLQQRPLQAGDSSSPQRKLESDADLVAATTAAGGTIPHCSGDGAATIPKSGLKIKNRCTKEDLNRENLASIPKSGLEIKNRCTKEDLNWQNLASIRKSGLEIKNRCTQQCINGENLASIRKFGPEIKNR